jgi:hypothetical protein
MCYKTGDGIMPKLSYEYVKEHFHCRGYELITKEYFNSHQKLEYRCSKHPEVIQSMNYNNLQQGKGCPICANHVPVTSLEQANELLRKTNAIAICVSYSGNCRKPSLMRCLIDGHEWNAPLDHILHKRYGCPKCSNLARYKTVETVNKRLKEDGISSLKCVYYAGSASSNHSKFECNVCGYSWNGKVSNIVSNNRRCPKCSKLARVKTKEEANFILDSLDCGIVCTTYAGAVAKLSEFLCLECNKTWMSTLNNINNGNRCPYCAASKGETAIAKWLDEHNLYYKQEYYADGCNDIGKLRFDFYIETQQGFFLCEYNGIQHYAPVDFANRGTEWAENQFQSVQRRDGIKKKYCADKEIDLLIIPHTQYKNIPDILNEKIYA